MSADRCLCHLVDNQFDISYPVIALANKGLPQTLAGDYCLWLHLQKSLPQTLLGKRATIRFVQQNAKFFLHGVITAIDGQSALLHSPLYPLRLRVQSRVYVEQDFSNILIELLQYHCLTYRFLNRQPQKNLKMTMQYQESDYDFFIRLLAEHGYWCNVEQSETSACITISHHFNDATPVINLPYVRSKGMPNLFPHVFALEQHTVVMTEKIAIDDYNAFQPNADLYQAGINNTAVRAYGYWYCYAQGQQSLSESLNLSHLRQQVVDGQRQIWLAKTTALGLSPGQCISIDQHPWPVMNTCYRIVAIQHHYNRKRNNAYENCVTLVKPTQAFRNEPLQKPQVGFMHAKTLTLAWQPVMDDNGHYRVQYLFEPQQQQRSLPLRRLQALTGVATGMHWPLQAQQEVVLACVDGCIEKPVIVGFVPDAEHTYPVTSRNASQLCWQTWGGQQLLMEDQALHARIDLANQQQQQLLRLDASFAKQQVLLRSNVGYLTIRVGKDIIERCQQLIQTAAYQVVAVADRYSLQCPQGKLVQKSGTANQNKAHHAINFNSKNWSRLLAQAMVIQSQGHLNIKAQQGDWWAEQITWQAKRQITLQSKRGLVIKHGTSQICLSPEGCILITAPKVTFHHW